MPDSAEITLCAKLTNEKIHQAREAYYKKVQPIMTDAEFDALEKGLKELVKKHPEAAQYATELNKVGSDLNANGRVKHVRPMLSIENKYTKEELVEFFREVGVACAEEPKRDGISCELRYNRGGQLQAALTRGDGESGEDITAAIKHVKSIPQTIPVNQPTFIRGELVMRNSELDRINAELKAAGQKLYMSTRNLTAGTVKQKDMKVVASRKILFMPWDVYGDNDSLLPDSHVNRMDMLTRYGFPKYDGQLVGLDSAVLTALDILLVFNKQGDINADGVVIKVDSHKTRAALGVSRHTTNYQVCFKPQSASGTTYLRRVVWQIGRTGKLTPVAECDPVVLAGAVITRANLNNITWINTMGLKIGAKVEMLRSGDVIPQIVKVVDDSGEEIVVPVNCPSCESKLEVLDEGGSGIVTSWCINPGCAGRVADLFSFIGDRENLEIDNLGPEMSAKLVAEGYARNLGELFTFQSECLVFISALGEDKFTAKMQKKGFSSTITKMVKSMEKAKVANWDRWIASLGIPMIGHSLGKVIAQTFKLSDGDMRHLPTVFKTIKKDTIEGFGERKTAMLQEWAADPKSQVLVQALYDAGVRPRSMVVAVATGPQPLAGTAFCITGEFSESREVITKKLEDLGAVSKSGVSKKTNLLIVGSAPGKTKVSAAQTLNVKMVDKVWLQATLEANGLTLGNTNSFTSIVADVPMDAI